MNKNIIEYCPRCGEKRFLPSCQKSFECKSCKFTLFVNTAATVSALIENMEGQLLLTKRKEEPHAGTWDLPGGFVDYDESLEDALKREMDEELSLEIDSLQYFCSTKGRYEYKGVLYHTIDSSFKCLINDFEGIKAGDDVEDFRFIGKNSINFDDIGLDAVKDIISKLLLHSHK